MRFVSIYRPTKVSACGPSPENIQAMMAFVNEAVRAGVLLATEGFGPSTASDFKVRMTNGDISTTDGPFAETKEIIGGFAIMQVKSRKELVDWTRRFMKLAGDGECEIHQLSDESPIDFARR
jgi:hypothetical protein